MTIIEIGIDVGFSGVKWMKGGGRGSFVSVVGRAETGTVGYSFGGNGLAVRFQDEQYFSPVGKTALVRGRQAGGRRDGSWVLGGKWKRLLAAALGQAVENDATVRLVTGLPVDDWGSFADPLKERLVGETFTFQLKGQQEQSVTIESVMVPSQPFGTLFSVMTNSDGYIQDNEYTTGFGAVADVGGHTTNVQVIDAMASVDGMSASRPFGLLHALDGVRDRINATFTRLEFTTHDVASALQHGGTFNAGGEVHSIQPYAASDLDAFTSDIVSFVNDTIPRSSRVDWLLLTGGGVLAVGGQLQGRLRKSFGRVVLVDDPRWANVRGYLAIARRATREGLWR